MTPEFRVGMRGVHCSLHLGLLIIGIVQRVGRKFGAGRYHDGSRWSTVGTFDTYEEARFALLALVPAQGGEQ